MAGALKFRDIIRTLNTTTIMPKNVKKQQNETAKKDQKPKENSPVTVNANGTIFIKILAKPGAKQNNITDITEEGVNIQISAPPVEGAANTELIKYLSSILNLRRSDLTLEKGSKSRDKCVSIASSTLKPEEILEKLNKEKNS